MPKECFLKFNFADKTCGQKVETKFKKINLYLNLKANAEACAHFGGDYTLEIKHAQMGRNLTDAVECVLRRSGLSEKNVTEKVNF